MDLSIRKLLTIVGIESENFSVTFCLSDVSGIELFKVREDELAEIYRILSGITGQKTLDKFQAWRENP
jgi:hypothetical protein